MCPLITEDGAIIPFVQNHSSILDPLRAIKKPFDTVAIQGKPM